LVHLLSSPECFSKFIDLSYSRNHFINSNSSNLLPSFIFLHLFKMLSEKSINAFGDHMNLSSQLCFSSLTFDRQNRQIQPCRSKVKLSVLGLTIISLLCYSGINLYFLLEELKKEKKVVSNIFWLMLYTLGHLYGFLTHVEVWTNRNGLCYFFNVAGSFSNYLLTRTSNTIWFTF